MGFTQGKMKPKANKLIKFWDVWWLSYFSINCII